MKIYFDEYYNIYKTLLFGSAIHFNVELLDPIREWIHSKNVFESIFQCMNGQYFPLTFKLKVNWNGHVCEQTILFAFFENRNLILHLCLLVNFNHFVLVFCRFQSKTSLIDCTPKSSIEKQHFHVVYQCGFICNTKMII